MENWEDCTAYIDAVSDYLGSGYYGESDYEVNRLADAFEYAYGADRCFIGRDDPDPRFGCSSRGMRATRSYHDDLRLPILEDVHEYAQSLMASPALDMLRLPHEGTMAEYYLESSLLGQHWDDDEGY